MGLLFITPLHHPSFPFIISSFDMPGSLAQGILCSSPDQTPLHRTEQRHGQCGRGRRASLAAGASRARGRRSLRALQARVRTMDWNALYPSITGLNFQLNCTAAGRKISGPTQVRVGGRLQRRPGGQA